MKNINIVNKVVSKNMNISLNVVTAVNNFYWKTSRKKLVEAKETTIFWKHIGSITISKYKVYNEIKKVIAKIRFTRLSEKYSEEGKQKVLDQAYKKLRLLLQHRNNIAKDEYDKRISGIITEGTEELQEDN